MLSVATAGGTRNSILDNVHDGDGADAVDLAARGITTGGATKDVPIVQQLCQRYDLNAKQGCAAIATANLIRARAL